MRTKLCILALVISLISSAQRSDTTRNVLLNKDTLLTIKRQTAKTATVNWTDTSVLFVTRRFAQPTQDSVPIVPPPPSSSIQGFGQTSGGNNFAPTLVSTASDITNKAKSNTNLVITKGGTYVVRLNFSNTTNLTIDGSKADGPVIFNNNNNGDCVSFEGTGNHDIIITNVAIRNAGNDCAAINGGGYRIVFDHCSMANGGDGAIDITTGSHDISVQWCIVGSAASGGSLFDYPGTHNLSIHHNLYLAFERNALIGSQQSTGLRTDMVCDFANNVIWQWQNYGTNVNFGGTANIRNNYYYSTSNPGNAVQTKNGWGNYPQGYAYVNGNFSGNGVAIDGASDHALWPIPDQYAITMQDACTAAKLVVVGVGPQKKDQTDINLIKQVNLPGCQMQ